MTSFVFKSHLDALIEATDTSQHLIKYLFVLSRGYEQVASDLTDVLHVKNRTLFSKQQMDTQERFYEYRRHADAFPIGQVFNEVMALQATVQAMREGLGAEDDLFLDTLEGLVRDFYGALEACVKSNDEVVFVKLMGEAHHLYPVLMTARQLVQTMKRALHEARADDLSPEEQTLTIVYEEPQTYARLVGKLTALQQAYDKLGTITETAADVQPLDLIHIESGSLLLTVRGDACLIEILTGLITRFAAFVYNRFGARGGATSIPERVMATQLLVNLADELDRAGFHAPLDDEPALKRAALAMRDLLAALIVGEPSVALNGERYHVEPAARDRYRAESERILTGTDTLLAA